MSEPKRVLPLLEGFLMGEPISDHDGVRCCPAMQEATEDKYIVKIISIPASGAKLEALLLAGAFSSRESALAYFRDLAEGAADEAELLEKLSRLEGFSAYEGWQIEPMEDGKGYALYLLGKYRPTLERHLSRNPMTHLGAVNLGLDLCSALAVCRRSGHLYVDLKPSNIFICEDNEYRIGDLGFVSLSSLQYASLPEKYHSVYTAPEIADAYSALNDTLDIYATGLILYQVYNNGQLPPAVAAGESLPAPEYADYEMASIILKACSADPAQRWPDPGQMGQALVNYMQRNGANDIPIVPPAVPVVEIPEEVCPEELAEEDPSTEAILSEVDLALEAMGLDLPEEQALPDAAAEETPAENVTDAFSEIREEPADEVTLMLAQADELIAHETPEPVVAPAPIDVPIPPRIYPESESSDVETDSVLESEEAAEEESWVAESSEFPEDEAEEDPYEAVPPPRQRKGLMAALLCLLVAAAICVAGYLYYKHIYQQTIYGLSLSGKEDKLTVTLVSNIDDDLLTVVCTDVYGNTLRQPVSQGVAVFDTLRPSTRYTIRVEISGFHELLGKISETYTTATQTSIVDLIAVTGPENGSVILTFTAYGPEPLDWTVRYFADGEAQKSITFPGRKVTIPDLTVGKQYYFYLEPNSPLYLVGSTMVSFTASNMIYPENLTIQSFLDNDLTVSWNTPEGESVTSWTVRCYSDAGYDKTITVTDTTAVFHDLDRSASYHIDVRAANMSMGNGISLGANSLTLTELTADTSDPESLVLRWAFEGNAPTGGWLVQYRTSSQQEMQVLTTEGTEAVIAPVIPGEEYTFLVKPANGTPCFNNSLTCTVPGGEIPTD